MPIAPTYPGVYIQENKSSVHTITGVATSITAFVGYTARGLDSRAARIFSFADFERGFGGLAADSELSYAVQQFFQNGGGEAYVVRVPKHGAKAALLTLQDKVSGGADVLQITARSTGVNGNNLVVDVDYDAVPAADPKAFNLTITDQTSGVVETFDAVTMDKNKGKFAETVVNDDDNGSKLISVKAVGATPNRPAQSGTVGGDLAVDANGKPTGIANAKNLSIKITSDLPTTPAISGVSVPFLAAGDPVPASVLGVCRLLERKINGAIQKTLPAASVSCVPSDSGKGIRVVANIPNAMDAVVTFAAGNTQTSYKVKTIADGTHLTLDQNYVGNTNIQTDASAPLVGQVAVTNGSPDVIGTGTDFTLLIVGQTLTFDANNGDADVALELSTGAANAAHYWLGTKRKVAAVSAFQQGDDGSSLPQTAELIGDPVKFTGIYALEKVDLFNILCIPDATRAQTSDPGQLDSTVDPNSIFSTALAYCKTRRAFLLIDSPPNVNDVNTAADWKTSGLTVHDASGYAATYFPRLRLADPLNGYQLRTFAPCGILAGLYARTDAARGVWKAPAGTEATLSGVQGAVYKLTDSENGVLNPLGLNCVRLFPVYGPVCWGARTIAGADADASEWKYVPVRRFALFLEESLYRGSKWVVFEPNDEPLWSQIRLNFGAFMHTLFRQGAFQGTTPQQAYFVKCDDETTTQNDIDNGIVNILVGFAPLKPAEFVIIQIQQIAGQIQT